MPAASPAKPVRTKFGRRDFALSATPPVDGYAMDEREWTERGIDALYVGDVVRIRSGVKQVAGHNSEGDVVYRKKRVERGRDIADLVEQTTIGRVTSVALRAGTPTVYFHRLWTSGQGEHAAGGFFSIPGILADNAEPAGIRQREIRRLAGSGPSVDVRASISPRDHSDRCRREAFCASLERTGRRGHARLLEGDTYVKGSDPLPVDDARIQDWRTGVERIPSWVLTALRIVESEMGVDVESDIRHVDPPLPAALVIPAPPRASPVADDWDDEAGPPPIHVDADDALGPDFDFRVLAYDPLDALEDVPPEPVAADGRPAASVSTLPPRPATTIWDDAPVMDDDDDWPVDRSVGPRRVSPYGLFKPSDCLADPEADDDDGVYEYLDAAE